jgi:archaellum biogenesis ATPase FlaH
MTEVTADPRGSEDSRERFAEERRLVVDRFQEIVGRKPSEGDDPEALAGEVRRLAAREFQFAQEFWGFNYYGRDDEGGFGSAFDFASHHEREYRTRWSLPVVATPEIPPHEDEAAAVREPSRPGAWRYARELEPKRVEWLWDGWIPKGMVSMLVGDPGEGKSQLSCFIAAGVTTGAEGFAQGSVLMLASEDSLEHMVVPRLIAAGADQDRVILAPDGRMLTVPDDLNDIREAIVHGGVSLVIVDTIDAHFSGSVDSHNNKSVRRAIHPMKLLADETGVAFLTVHHMNKSVTETKAMYRTGGSIAYQGVVRSSMLLGRSISDDPRTDRRYLLHTKSTGSALHEPLEMRIEEHLIRQPSMLKTSRIVPIGVGEVTEEEVLGRRRAPGAPKDERVREWLGKQLAGGQWVPSAEVKTRADEELGVSESTLKRVIGELGVEVRRDGRSTFWRLDPVGPFRKTRRDA